MPIFIQPNLTPVIAALSAQQQALTEEINAQKQTLTSAINAQQQVLTVAISEQQQALSAAIESNEQAVSGELLTTKQQLLASAESTAQAVSNKGVIKSIQRGTFGAGTSGAVIAAIDLSKSVLEIARQASYGSSSWSVQRLDFVSGQFRVINEYSGTMVGLVAWQVIEYE